MSAVRTNWVRNAAAIVAATLLATAAASGVAGAATTVASSSSAARAIHSTPSLTRFDARLVRDINRARRRHGLHRLAVAPGTTDIAHRWSCHLAAAGILAHNHRVIQELATHGSRQWMSYEENVGYVPAGWSARALFRTYMHSPAHRRHILDPSARYIGSWSSRDGPYRFNTIDFVGTSRNAYRSSYGPMRVTC
jgi:uncharacterized protein YkwD